MTEDLTGYQILVLDKEFRINPVLKEDRAVTIAHALCLCTGEVRQQFIARGMGIEPRKLDPARVEYERLPELTDLTGYQTLYLEAKFGQSTALTQERALKIAHRLCLVQHQVWVWWRRRKEGVELTSKLIRKKLPRTSED